MKKENYKNYENVLLRKDIYQHIRILNLDSENLFKAIVEISTTSPQYSNMFCTAFHTLLDSELLEKNEIALTSTILDYYAHSNGSFPSLNYLKNIGYTPLKDSDYIEMPLCDFKKFPHYVSIITEELIETRKTHSFISKNKDVIQNMAYGYSTPTNFIYTLEDYRNETAPINIKNEYFTSQKVAKIGTNISIIDNNFGGLNVGSFNCLIKNEYADDFFEITLLYNSVINEKQNVCYISTAWSFTDILNKLLSIHSATLNDTTLKLNYFDLKNGNANQDIKDKVLEDFKKKSGNRFQIFNNTCLAIFNLESLRKLLLGVNHKFTALTNKPIELLIIENLENLRFEKDGKIEDNTSKIIQIYSNFFIRQSILEFRSNPSPLTVLVSSQICNKSTMNAIKSYDIQNNYYTGIEQKTTVLEKYSDKVITFVMGKKEKQSKSINGLVQIIKSSDKKIMDESISVKISLENCNIIKEDTSNENNNEITTIDNAINNSTTLTIEELNEFTKGLTKPIKTI